MQQHKERKNQKKIGKERLQRIIEMMKGIEDHTLDPFLLNVDEIIRIIQEHFPDWDLPEELNLDSEAIHHLASVVKLQSEWVKHRSSSLYTDPFLLEERLMQKNKLEVLEAFLAGWHPTVEIEQLTPNALNRALLYWEDLVPLKERWPELMVQEVDTGIASRDELVDQQILRDEAFSSELERFWHDLIERVEKTDASKIRYWNFIGAETYEETVHRAYITSFLITYGYASLEIIPLEEEIFIKPLKEPTEKLDKQAVSIPISFSFEEWKKWKDEKSDE